MANPDLAPGALAKPLPRALQQQQRRVAEATALRIAYNAVDARDKKTCRATGRPVVAGAVDPRMRLERHHLVPRSLSKGAVDDPKNIVTLAADVHRLVTAHCLEIEGTNADQRLIFRWNRRLVKPGAEPFVLKSKRKSQRRED